MKYITHLVFSGGGLSALSILGVIRYLYTYNLNDNIHDVLGTSMGSIIALLFALKIPYEKLEDLVKKISTDDDVLYIKKNNIADLFINNGIESTRCYTDHIKKYIKDTYDLDDLTFIELSKKFGINLYISASNINLSCNTIFSLHNYPNISVFDAVAASMTLPFLSKPIYIDGYYYIDGGITNNFPIFIFDKIPKENILGVVVNYDSINNLSEDIPKNTLELSFLDYSKKVFSILIYSIFKETYYNNIKDDDNILVINDLDTKFIQLEFNKDYIKKKITLEEIDNLITIGYINMFNYMKKYQDNL